MYSGVLVKNTYYIYGAGGLQSIYEQPAGGAVAQTEVPIMAGGRIGVAYIGGVNVAEYHYEITDHLGNVRAVIKREVTTLETTYYADYYPFGWTMPGRHGGSSYRYAYQGQEKDEETGWEAFELRMYDGRVGRWMTTDPYSQYHSPYLAMGNNPIRMIDPDGGNALDIFIFNADGTYSGERIEAEGSHKGIIKDYYGEGQDLEFTFVDQVNYPNLIVTPQELSENGWPFNEEEQNFIDRVEVISKFEIQKELMKAGVFEPNPGALVQLWTKSRGLEAPIDFSAKASLLDRQSTLFLIEDKKGKMIGHDFRNYGNFLWGATTKIWKIPYWVVKIGSNVDVIINEFALDSADDQSSIRLGRQYAKQMSWKRLSF